MEGWRGPSGWNAPGWARPAAGGGGGAAVTWNPSDKGGAIALSNGNLTASFTSTNNYVAGLVRATASVTGKKYWRVRLDAVTGTDVNISVGAILGTVATTVEPGSGSAVGSTVAWDYDPTQVIRGGQIMKDGGYGGDIADYAANDFIDVAADVPNLKIWFRKNGTGTWNLSGSADPVTNTGGAVLTSGTLYPVFGGANGPAVTAFFADDGSGTLPSGFSWLG
jgi:hypothetical protein